MLQLDHLVLCVSELEASAGVLLSDHGLASVPGGRHPGHGTANWIVPLGDAYLELVSVVDPGEASRSPFGSWVASRSSSSLGVDGACLRTDDVDEVCSRLDIEAVAMSRRTPGGVVLKWRLAGLTEALRRDLPFFIHWDVQDAEMPGRMEVPHEVDVHSVELNLVGDIATVSDWVFGAPGVRIAEGSPSMGATIDTSAGLVSL